MEWYNENNTISVNTEKDRYWMGEEFSNLIIYIYIHICMYVNLEFIVRSFRGSMKPLAVKYRSDYCRLNVSTSSILNIRQGFRNRSLLMNEL